MESARRESSSFAGTLGRVPPQTLDALPNSGITGVPHGNVRRLINVYVHTARGYAASLRLMY